MGRRGGLEEEKAATRRTEPSPPIPLEPVNLLAGLAPGVELVVDDLPAGVAGNTTDESVTVTVEEVGKLLRCGESTIRRLIRTAVLRPVVVDGKIRVRRAEIDAYRASLGIGTPEKPSE